MKDEPAQLADYTRVIRVGANEQTHTGAYKEVNDADEGYDLHSMLSVRWDYYSKWGKIYHINLLLI